MPARTSDFTSNTREISDLSILERFPGAPITHDNKAFYRGLIQGRLLVNRCSDCGTWHHPPRFVCPNCWSDTIVATEVSGEGEVYLFTLLHQGPPADGVDYSRPHPVATIELDEQPGLRITTTIIGCNPSNVDIGMRMMATPIERDGMPMIAFTPVWRG